MHPKEEILDLIVRQQELNFSPGERYLYSNTGYFLLSEIIERATGQTLRAYTTEHLFERGEGGQVSGFSASNDRAWDIWFEKEE